MATSLSPSQGESATEEGCQQVQRGSSCSGMQLWARGMPRRACRNLCECTTMLESVACVRTVLYSAMTLLLSCAVLEGLSRPSCTCSIGTDCSARSCALQQRIAMLFSDSQHACKCK
jgi:hypothetical protein